MILREEKPGWASTRQRFSDDLHVIGRRHMVYGRQWRTAEGYSGIDNKYSYLNVFSNGQGYGAILGTVDEDPSGFGEMDWEGFCGGSMTLPWICDRLMLGLLVRVALSTSCNPPSNNI